MTRPRIVRRLLPTSLLVVLAVLLGGLAYGYWSATGSGAGKAATGTTLAVTLSPGTPAAALYPGGQANVVLTVSNPNAFLVHIGSLGLDAGQGAGGFAVDAGHAGCAVATLTFTTETNGGAGWSVPAKVGAGDGTLPVTLTSALTMSVEAANACQGATFTVYVAAGP